MTITAPPSVEPDVAAPHRAGRIRRGPASFGVLGMMIVAVLLVLSPFVVVVINSFKTASDYAANGPLSLPHGWTWGTLTALWQRVDFSRKLLNSLWISGSVAILGVAVSVLNAYAIGIGRMRGRIWFLLFFLTANLLPQEGLVYPLYYLAKQVHLYDSQWAIVLIFTVIQSSFGTYLLSSVYAEFPRELLEAAAIDGAGKLRTLWNVVIPMSRPTLSVLFTFFFIWTWNEFLLPLVFLLSNDKQTVPVALAVLQGDRLMDATASSASALLGIAPALIFFLIFQRTLTRGIAAGAVK